MMHMITAFEQAEGNNTLGVIVRYTEDETNADILAYVANMTARGHKSFTRMELTPITRTSCFVKLYFNT